jgi:hypothetical protein
MRSRLPPANGLSVFDQGWSMMGWRFQEHVPLRPDLPLWNLSELKAL